MFWKIGNWLFLNKRKNSNTDFLQNTHDENFTDDEGTILVSVNHVIHSIISTRFYVLKSLILPCSDTTVKVLSIGGPMLRKHPPTRRRRNSTPSGLITALNQIHTSSWWTRGSLSSSPRYSRRSYFRSKITPPNRIRLNIKNLLFSVYLSTSYPTPYNIRILHNAIYYQRPHVIPAFQNKYWWNRFYHRKL